MLDDFPLPDTAVPHELPGHASVGRWELGAGTRRASERLPSCGGVDGHIELTLEHFTYDPYLAEVLNRIFDSRPTHTAFFWAIDLFGGHH